MADPDQPMKFPFKHVYVQQLLSFPSVIDHLALQIKVIDLTEEEDGSLVSVQQGTVVDLTDSTRF